MQDSEGEEEEEELFAENDQEDLGCFVTPFWVVEEESRITYILQEMPNMTFSVHPDENGVTVNWTLEEPGDALFNSLGISLKTVHQQVMAKTGQYYIPSPKRLVMASDLIKVAQSASFRVLKFAIQGEKVSQHSLVF